MPANRYSPTVSVKIADTEVKDGLINLAAAFSATDQVPTIEAELSNLNGKYDEFNWAKLEKLWFTFIFSPFLFRAQVALWFDGLKFVKPLVVNAYDSSSGSRKSRIESKENIVGYTAAKSVVNALLEEYKKPFTYWSISNLGRDDILSGKKFTVGETELLMREQRWTMNKESGWLIEATAWEKT